MKKISFSDMRCSLARSLDVIGDWWTPLIVRDIFLGVTRFDDIAEDLGISRNLLTRRLKHLVGKGVLGRANLPDAADASRLPADRGRLST